MRLRILASLLILLGAANIFAQDTQCSLKLAELPDVPELFGFRMGITTDQVKARVPQVVFGQVDEFGSSKTSINPDFDSQIDKSTFAGIRTVSLDFLDGRLTSLWLGYDSSFKWQTVPDFVKGISQSLRLPNAWISWRSRGQQLRCADFQMTVTIVAEGPSFHIVDETAGQTIASRREAREEQESANAEEPTEEIIADKHRKIFYPQGCQPDKQIKETDRIIFKTKEQAEKAGYKPARQCL